MTHTPKMPDVRNNPADLVSRPEPTAARKEALEALELLRKRAYSHAEKSNGPQEMRDWIDRDADKVRAALETPACGWRGIETMPNDGSDIWVCQKNPDGSLSVHEERARSWRFAGRHYPILFWMPRTKPLPPAPKHGGE